MLRRYKPSVLVKRYPWQSTRMAPENRMQEYMVAASKRHAITHEKNRLALSMNSHLGRTLYLVLEKNLSAFEKNLAALETNTVSDFENLKLILMDMESGVDSMTSAISAMHTTAMLANEWKNSCMFIWSIDVPRPQRRAMESEVAGAFVSFINHLINNPLAIEKLILQIFIAREEISPEKKQMLRSAHNRISDTFEQLKLVKRFSHERYVKDTAMLDIDVCTKQ